MATDAAIRAIQDHERAEKHGRIIKERRLDLGLKRPAFVAEVAKQGQDMTPDYLNKIESGARALANASPELREAIRAVLGYSPEQWQELTGLYTPSADAPTPSSRFSAASLGYHVPEAEVEIPEALLEAAALYGDTPEFAGLREPRWQEWLATAPHRRRPQTAGEWLHFFSTVKDTIEP